MFGEKIKSPVTIRAIVNRGSEQGAQHSQSLHSWFMHIPGLKVVMPSSANDARDLLISSILSNEPVIFIDDRWLYETREIKKKVKIYELSKYKNKKIINGNDITIVSSGYCTQISKKAINILNEKHKVFPELIDISLLSNLPISIIEKSLKKTKKIICVEGGWEVCSLSSEIFSRIFTNKSNLKKDIIASKINLYNTAAPTNSKLEKYYFPNTDKIIKKVLKSVNN
jgi:pyruvate dehydrogenase E1 component beta subunit